MLYTWNWGASPPCLLVCLVYPAGKALELGFTISLAKLLLIEQQDWPIAASYTISPKICNKVAGMTV